MPADPIDLKPCPWCGADGNPEFFRSPGNWQILCRVCYGQGPAEISEAAAAAAWNRRAGLGVEGRPATGVVVPVETLAAIRLALVNCDSELSAQGHGRPQSAKTELLSMSNSCRVLTREIDANIAAAAKGAADA